MIDCKFVHNSRAGIHVDGSEWLIAFLESAVRKKIRVLSGRSADTGCELVCRLRKSVEEIARTRALYLRVGRERPATMTQRPLKAGSVTAFHR